MNRILVCIDVPATSGSYETWIYPYMRIGRILELLRNYVNDQAVGEYQAEESTVLCNAQGVPLNPNISVREAGLHNGSRLILI